MADDPVTPMKACRKCGIEKPETLEFFSRNGPSKRLLRNTCKPCYAAQTALWRAKNPEKYQAMKTRRIEKTKEERWTPEWELRFPLLRCPKCKEAKPHNPNHFSRGPGISGLKSWCQTCCQAEYHGKGEHYRAIKRARHAVRAVEQKEHLYEQGKRWREENREAYNAHMRAGKARRRARLLSAGGTYTRHDVARLLIAQKKQCWWCECRLADYHVDHRIPLARGGSNDASNLVISCPTCNRKKSAKMPWEIENPRLL